MKKFGITLLAALSSGIACGVNAQNIETTKSGLRIEPVNFATRVNSQGYTISNFKYRVTAGGCEGSQDYKGPDSGVSPTRWTSKKNIDGGVQCSGGQWYYGGGPRQGLPGGSVNDLFVRGGKYYWVRS